MKKKLKVTPAQDDRAQSGSATSIPCRGRVELLLNAPVRIQNLASIDPDRHLLDVGGRSHRAVHLRFPAVG
jgi:hypothetical protein